MSFVERKGNPNYCATIIEITNLIPLEKCDNIQGTNIFGNHVIVSKDVKVGDVGVFFPVETSIKEHFLSVNNLYRDKTLNTNSEMSGFFELNGRVRCMKLRGYKSEGFYMPLQSLYNIVNKSDICYIAELPIGTEFDYVDGKLLCEKYLVPVKQVLTSKSSKKDKKLKSINRLIEGQFHFHIDTLALGKNIHKFDESDIISITEKLHGSSFVVSNILCKRKLSILDRLAKFLRAHVKTQEYANIYSSRTVIKNKYATNNPGGFYKEDIWGAVNKELSPFLEKGMTIYGEVVGYLESGKMIQKSYDYGCTIGKHDNYIYRITYTNEDGKVYEWSMLQVQQWCKEKGLRAVPLHYYGTIFNFLGDAYISDWRDTFLTFLTDKYLEKKCPRCKNDVPNEGVVVRREILDIDSYKHKSFLFKVRESKEADEGISNIEDTESKCDVEES